MKSRLRFAKSQHKDLAGAAWMHEPQRTLKLRLLPHTKNKGTVHLSKSQSRGDDQADDPTRGKAAWIVCNRDLEMAAFIMLLSTQGNHHII